MSQFIRSLMVLATLALLASLGLAAKKSPATITSDELEIQNNGELTIFTGHVVLTQDAYTVRADKMVRTKATGIVDATGHVVGDWISPKKEKVHILGDLARYDPAKKTLDLWGPHRVEVDLNSEKGQAAFHGDRGWASTDQPGKAKLIGQVTGHVIPASTS